MVTRTVTRPVFLTSAHEILGEYKAPGVAIGPEPEDSGKLRITAPDEAAADAAEVWLSELDSAGH
ncbi:hypothetical protein MHZ93_01130 [Roseomonas sp. ACRSG]|nr:hypothetical protein [Roseomonas sp. ACRSG]